MKTGRRSNAVVPVLPDLAERLIPGTSVTFYEAIPDPSGDPVPAPSGDRLTVTLRKVTDQNYAWVGRRLYSISWDPKDLATESDAKVQRSREDARPEMAHE